MTYEQLVARLADAGVLDPAAFLHELYHALRVAYRANQRRLGDMPGDDEGLFGFAVFKNGWAQIEEAVVRYGDGIRTDRPKGSLTVYAGNVRLKVYRGGPDESYDIETFDPQSGSFTKVSIAHKNSQQLSLFAEAYPDDAHEVELTDWFVVHTGNMDSGLANVWIGAPKLWTLQNPTTWAFVVPLPDMCDQFGCTGHEPATIEAADPSLSGPAHHELSEPILEIRLKDESLADGDDR